jgi:hypothetical protein
MRGPVEDDADGQERPGLVHGLENSHRIISRRRSERRPTALLDQLGDGVTRCVSPLQTSEVVDLTPEVARGISRGSGRPQSVWVLRGGVLLALPSFWSPEAADSAGIPIRMVDDRPDRSMSV